MRTSLQLGRACVPSGSAHTVVTLLPAAATRVPAPRAGPPRPAQRRARARAVCAASIELSAQVVKSRAFFAHLQYIYPLYTVDIRATIWY